MNTVQRIAKNAAALLGTQAISYLLAFFYAMYAARYLGPSNYGVISFAVAFTSLFSFVTDIGLSSLTVREVARDKSLAPRYMMNTAVMKLILAGIFFGLMALIVNAMGYPRETITVVYLVAFSTVIQSFSHMFYTVYQAFERMEYQALAQILNSVLIFTGVMLAIKFELGVEGFAFLYCGAGITVLLLNFIIFIFKFGRRLPKWLSYHVSINREFLKHTLKAALPFTLTLAIAGIFLRIDVIMISAIKGDADAGYYNAACNMIMVLLVTSGLFISAVFPVMSRLFVSSRDSLKLAADKSSKYMFIMGLPIAVGTFLLADRIVLTIYGTQFDQAATALKILILAIPLRFICHSTGWTLAAINREPLRTISIAIAIAVNIVLNFILIPRYGTTGAGIATVISQALMFLLFLYFVEKNFHLLPLHKIVIKPFIACAAMGVLVYFIREESLTLVIPAAVLLYFALLFLLRTFDAKDKRMFKDVIKGISKMGISIKNQDTPE